MEAKKTAKNGVRWRFVVTPYAPHQERRWPNDNDKEVSTHSEKTWLSFLFSPKKKPYGLIVRFCCGYCTIIFHAKLMPSLLKYEIHSRTKLIPEWKSFQNMIMWIAFQFYNLLMHVLTDSDRLPHSLNLLPYVHQLISIKVIEIS